MDRDIDRTVDSLKRTYAASPDLRSQSHERHRNPKNASGIWSGICQTYTFPDREITIGFADEGISSNPYDLTVTMGDRFYQLDLATTSLAVLESLPSLLAEMIDHYHLRCQPVLPSASAARNADRH